MDNNLQAEDILTGLLCKVTLIGVFVAFPIVCSEM
jgi:hypothetical protein